MPIPVLFILKCKTIFGMLALCMLSPSVFSQSSKAKEFSIVGDISRVKLDVEEVVLAISDSTGFRKLTAKPIGGKFSFNGELADACEAQMYLKVRNDSVFPTMYFRFFIIEAAKYKLVCKNDTFSKASLEGTKTIALYDKYKELEQPFINKLLVLLKQQQKLKNEKDTEGLKRIASQLGKIDMDIRDFNENIARKNLDNWIGIIAMSALLRPPTPQVERTESLRQLLTTSYGNSYMGRRLKSEIEFRSMTSVGKTAPDLDQPMPDGSMFQMASLRGKIVLVDFWASWCVPCRKLNPELRKLYEEYKGNRFEIVGISYDTDKEKWEKAIEEDKLPWLHISDLQSPNKAARLYDIMAIPQNLLIDKYGTIIGKNIGFAEIREKLKELL